MGPLGGASWYKEREWVDNFSKCVSRALIGPFSKHHFLFLTK